MHVSEKWRRVEYGEVAAGQGSIVMVKVDRHNRHGVWGPVPQLLSWKTANVTVV